MVKHGARWYEVAATKPEGMDTAEMAHKEWQAIVENRGAVFAGKRDQVTQPRRVRSNDEGEAGRKEGWQAVRFATKTHSSEDREV